MVMRKRYEGNNYTWYSTKFPFREVHKESTKILLHDIQERNNNYNENIGLFIMEV